MPPASSSSSSSSAQANNAKFTARIAELTGLDEESVRSQILPYLATFGDAKALHAHLRDLLGPGAAQTALIRDYVAARFPPELPPLPKPTSDPNAPPARDKDAAPVIAPLPSTARPYHASSSARSSRAKSKQNKDGRPAADLDETIQAAFQGGGGSVYRKTDVDFFPGGGGGGGGGAHVAGGSAAAAKKTAASHVASARPPATATPLAAQPSAVAVPTSAQSSGRSTPAPPQPPPPPPPTTQTSSSAAGRSEDAWGDVAPPKQVVELDELIGMLTMDEAESESRAAAQRERACFCNARLHLPHLHVPLCLSCGLVVCEALLPSPLLRTTRCPSCGTRPLLDATQRSLLLGRLSSERDATMQRHRERVWALREERARSAREAGRLPAGHHERQHDALFPQLGKADAHGRAGGGGGGGANAAGASRARGAASGDAGGGGGGGGADARARSRVFRIDKSGRGLTLDDGRKGGGGGRGKAKAHKKATTTTRAGRSERAKKAAAERQGAERDVEAVARGVEEMRVVAGAGSGAGRARSGAMTTTLTTEPRDDEEEGEQEGEDDDDDGVGEAEKEYVWEDGMRPFVDEDDDAFVLRHGRVPPH